MAGKFLNSAGMQDSILAERAANSRRKREGLMRHPICGYMCGCSSPYCGAFFSIREGILIPTPEECKLLIKAKKQGFEQQRCRTCKKLILSRTTIKNGCYIHEHINDDHLTCKQERSQPKKNKRIFTVKKNFLYVS